MKTRVISAIIALIIVIPFFLIGGFTFKIGVSILSILALKELINIRFKPNLLIKLLSYLSIILVIFNINNYLIIILLIFLLLIIVYHDNKKYNIEDAFYLIASILFLGLSFKYMIDLEVNNIKYLLYLILITTITDTYAYITGLLIGRHKLIEVISPKKTIEGMIGGTIMGVFVSCMYYLNAINSSENIFKLIMITLFLSLLGQFGDLLFSSIKRYYKTKDFSNIMPGHGGILDRLDSLIFVILGFMLIK